MRIAVVSPQLPTPAFPMRGMRHSEQLRLFALAGHDVQAVVPLPWAPWRGVAGEERDGSVTIAHPRYVSLPIGRRRHHPTLGTGAVLALERLSFARATAPYLDRPDIVLAHSVTFPGGLLGRIGPAPLVLTLHDNELYELAPRSRLLHHLIQRSLRAAACVVYQSEALREIGLQLAGAHQNRVIPIGIDTFDDLTRVEPARFTICCATRLIARKGVDRLIRVLERLGEEVPDARLVVVGAGPERGRLEALVRALGLQGNVTFTGWLDRRATMEEIARASVMALPSVMESLGAVYLEAMSLGVPALGTAGEGIATHIEHGVDGILVPPGNDERLFLELRELALDPGRARKIGEAGRRRFQTDGPSWSGNVTAHLALFEEIRQKRAGGA
jgi:glycosyltransferase involved in cell wall biosynthesis